ncbi:MULTISPECIES: hypothetical protein [unclassified Serratia (in: enterobacteria)]|nr:hypothetical protein [Serratia sp. C2(2)]MEE4447520.1 hypothetical protein [Serratia sp. C2(1)]
MTSQRKNKTHIRDAVHETLQTMMQRHGDRVTLHPAVKNERIK